MYHPGLLGAYVRKNDMSANPQLNEAELEDEQVIHLHETDKVDETDLEARFYRYGVRPEYLQIQRILNSRYRLSLSFRQFQSGGSFCSFLRKLMHLCLQFIAVVNSEQAAVLCRPLFA